MLILHRVSFLTLAPGRVDGLKIITGDDNAGSYQTLTVEWKIPSLLERNSKITGYVFKFNYTTEVGMDAFLPHLQYLFGQAYLSRKR